MLQYLGRGVGSIEDPRLAGMPGLGTCILEMRCKMHWDHWRIRQGRGALFAFDPTAMLTFGQAGSVRAMNDARSWFRFQPHTWDEEIRFAFELHASQVEAIDAARAGKDLTITVGVWFRLTEADVPLEWVHAYDTFTLNLVPQQWAALLDGMRFRRSLFIEVPLPIAEGEEGLARAFAALAEAEQQFRIGDWNAAVTSSRKVAEILRDEWEKPPADVKPPEWSFDHRQRSLAEALFRFASPAAHPAARSTAEDAREALAIAAALLRRATS